MIRLIRLFLMVLALAVLPLQSMAAVSAAPCPSIGTVKAAAHSTLQVDQHAEHAKGLPADAGWCKTSGAACSLVVVALPASNSVVKVFKLASIFSTSPPILPLQDFPDSLLRPPRLA